MLITFSSNSNGMKLILVLKRPKGVAMISSSSSSHATKGKNGVDSCSEKTKRRRHDGSSKGKNGVDSCSEKTKRCRHDGSTSSKETKGNGVDRCSGKTKKRRRDGSSSSKETKGNAIGT
jgi:hypothetical protein